MENEQQNPKTDNKVHTTAVLNEHGLPAVVEDQSDDPVRVGIPTLPRILLSVGYVISVLVSLWLMFGAIFNLLTFSPGSMLVALVEFGIVAIIVSVNILLRRYVQKKYFVGLSETELQKHKIGTKLAVLKNGRIAWTIVLFLWLFGFVSASLQAAANPASVAGLAVFMTFPLAVVSIVGIIITSVLIKKAKKQLLGL